MSLFITSSPLSKRHNVLTQLILTGILKETHRVHSYE
jgi:hypothetical protein